MESVLYPDKYFEVREHDAPTKYVWNGNTRVARVTDSLNTNQRVQRLRLWPGWNLCSVAVTATNALTQLNSSISAFNFQLSAFRWDQPTLTWLPVATNETLAVGTVLWLRASTNATATVTGTYTLPVNANAPTGPSFQPGAGLEALPLLGERAGVRADVPLWKFDGPSQTWLVRYGTNLPGQSDFPATLAAGESFMARSDASTTLEVPESALRIRYYHQDHLNSSTVLSDASGIRFEENANYPFGSSRVQVHTRGLTESYLFTGKESDNETRIAYFESRFLVCSIGRFNRVDPLAMTVSDKWLSEPQRFAAYAYCGNHPMTALDPSGRDFSDAIRWYDSQAAQAHQIIEDYGVDLVNRKNYVGAFLVAFADSFVPEDSMGAAVTLAGAATLPLSFGAQAAVAVGGGVIKDIHSQWGEIIRDERQEMNYWRTAAAGSVGLGTTAVGAKSDALKGRSEFFEKRLQSGMTGPASGYIYKVLNQREAGARAVWGITELTLDRHSDRVPQLVDSLTRIDKNK